MRTFLMVVTIFAWLGALSWLFLQPGLLPIIAAIALSVAIWRLGDHGRRDKIEFEGTGTYVG
jgi:predicted PurR-regulated permease PerM